MALTYDELTAITNKYIKPKLIDNFYSSNALWYKLYQMKKVRYTGGKPITVPILYAQNPSGGSYSGTDILETAKGKKWTAVPFALKFYYENMSIAETDRLQQGTEGVLKILGVETKSARKSIQHRMGTAVFADGSGNSNKDLDGLKTTTGAVGTGQYPPTTGGIATTDIAKWRAGGASTGIDSSTTALTMPALNLQFLRACNSTDSDDRPNFCVTTTTLYNSYWNKLQPIQRLTEDKDLGKGGFTHLMFNSAPVVFDSHCTANHWYNLNLNYFELYVHPDRDFATEKWQKPINQDVVVSKLWFAGNLCCSSRRNQTSFTALTS